ncbi:hypothetical protein C8J57DRAFT_626003 [Mycena rebaudengoi]|nr:hypothetical protein C8J57DRAFT_626003 [Mycena rebaudengoi]
MDPRDTAHGDALLQSPFSRFLRNNSAPTDEEAAAIRQFLSGLQKSFTALSGEIKAMGSTISDLTDQCRRLRETIEAHEALMSLARRLPEDVLQEIFRACLPSTGNPVMSSRVAPLLLTQVCANWRKIALCTPQLWAGLHVVVPNVSRLRQVTGAAETWLARSGALPLSITVAVSRACEPASDNIATMIDVLRTYSRRWKRIKITLSPRTILTPLTNLHVSDVPILETITFTSFGGGTWQNANLPLEIPWRRFNFLRAPTIRRASFASLGGNLCTLPLPWAYLRSLSLTGGDVKESSSFYLTSGAALSILRQCRDLQVCTVCISPDHSPIANDDAVLKQPSFTLRYLTRFTVDNREHSQLNAIAFFEGLRIPALKRFAYRGPKYDGNLPFTSLFSVVNSVESVVIDISGLTADAFTHCFERLPSLKRLRLESGQAYDPWSKQGLQTIDNQNPTMTINDIFRLLSPSLKAPHECLCPSLQRIESVRCEPLSDDVVLNFILLRKEVDHAVNHVAVIFTRQMEFNILPYLKEYIAEGLYISLEYPPPPARVPYSPWEGLEQSGVD